MTLSPSAVVDLARLAFLNAHLGKHKASAAYHRHALGQAWHNTPAWIEGRTLYAPAWRKHRAAFLASVAATEGGGVMARKDITDLMVCQAVAAYRVALGKCPTIIRLGSWRGRILVASCTPRQDFPHVALAAQTGEPEKVCYRAMERAEARGLIEAGVSLRTAWLTDAGEALLAQADAP